jgi:hypothetical protein
MIFDVYQNFVYRKDLFSHVAVKLELPNSDTLGQFISSTFTIRAGLENRNLHEKT